MRGRLAGSTTSTSAATRRPPKSACAASTGVDVKLQPPTAAGGRWIVIDPPVGGSMTEAGSARFSQPLQPAIIRRQRGVQGAVAVGQPLAAAQDVQGRGVRRQHAPATVQVQDADPAVVQQAHQTGASAHRRRPAPDGRGRTGGHAAAETSSSWTCADCQPPVATGSPTAQTTRWPSCQSRRNLQAVLAAAAAQSLVVRQRRPQLLLGVQIAGMKQLAGGQLPEAAPPFVVRVVDVQVLTRHVLSRLPAVEKLGESRTRTSSPDHSPTTSALPAAPQASSISGRQRRASGRRRAWPCAVTQGCGRRHRVGSRHDLQERLPGRVRRRWGLQARTCRA